MDGFPNGRGVRAQDSLVTVGDSYCGDLGDRDVDHPAAAGDP